MGGSHPRQPCHHGPIQALPTFDGGDIDGFGVGTHFTAAATGLLGYRFQLFGHGTIAQAGYRAFWQNYATRTDGSLFRWNVTLHGPIMGLTLRF